MAIVKKYPARIISIKSEIAGVYTLEFESLGKPFSYASGQFLHLAMDNDYDGSGQWPDSRCFSMQSNPDNETIRITYAVKGVFTKAMEEKLNTGTQLWLKLPYGDLFQQPHHKTNTVFIAGGTGITPYLSLFTHASFSEYINPKIYLGFRSKEYNLYYLELNTVKLCASTVKPSRKSGTSCVTIFYQDTDGILDIDHIFTENGTASSYFISGPPVMIKNFKQTLINKGIPASQVLTDDWE